MPASEPIQSGRIYAEVAGPVNTGLAIANGNTQAASISFYFTDSTGNFGNGSTTIPAGGQIATFLNQAPFNGPVSLSGSFTFTSSVPVFCATAGPAWMAMFRQSIAITHSHPAACLLFGKT